LNLRLSLFLALFIVLASSLFAQAPLHDNQIAIISINGTTFIDYVLDKVVFFGINKEVLKEFEQVFKKNSGSDLRKDFHNIGVLIYKGKDENLHTVGFKTGNFVPDNWYGEFQAIARQPLASQHIQTELREENGVKIIDFLSKKAPSQGRKPPELSFFFQNNNRVFFGLKDEINYASKANFKNQPDAVQKQIEKQTLFIEANIEVLNQVFKKNPNPQLGPVLGMIEPIRSIYVFFTEGEIMLRINCVNSEAAKNFNDMLAGMIGSFKQKLDNDLGQLKKPEDGDGWLLNSIKYFGEKGTIISSKETLDSIKLAHKDNIFMLKGTLPPLVRSGLVPIAAVGTLAAIAVPNFKKARSKARAKACFANQRVLLGATEMYNMDNTEMIKEMNDKVIQTLLEGQYLRSVPVCPDGGKYISEGDISADGRIKCTVHGSVEQY
jgi:competence protein ComGC